MEVSIPATANAAVEPEAEPEIAFVDLAAQKRRLGTRVEQALAAVLAHGQYIHGPEVFQLEDALARFCGAAHCVSCASGTDALQLALAALGVRPGDAVCVPAFTYAATAEAVVMLGAVPLFADVLPSSGNLDPQSMLRTLWQARQLGLRPRGAIAVDLFGQPAAYEELEAAADAEGFFLLADAAQSFGARRHGRRVGTLARITTTSFFPAKPLGAYGDGGAVFCAEEGLRTHMRSLRFHGLFEEAVQRRKNPHAHAHVGWTGRLDTLQAAILLQKLTLFADELRLRSLVAARYATLLGSALPTESRASQRGLLTPMLDPGVESAWALYTIRVGNRQEVLEACRRAKIPTAVHYPMPLYAQPPYRHFPQDPHGAPITEQLCREVLSLPMHPYLNAATQKRIVEVLRTCAKFP